MSKMIDMTGQQCGYWTVLARAESTKSGTARWLCRCVCGKEKVIVGSTLRNGKSTNCGCVKAEKSRENNGTYINEIGNRYGRLVVVSKDEELSIEKHRAYWVCKCDCGNTKIVSSKCLRDGKTKSCGCILSYGEELITKFLSQIGCRFVSQYSVAINDKTYRYDFAIYKDNQVACLVEFHGIQHYDEQYLHWGKPATVNQERDRIKEDWAKSHNVPLYIIPYLDIERIEEIMTNILIENKVLEGIIKDTAAAPDMEEAQEVNNE